MLKEVNYALQLSSQTVPVSELLWLEDTHGKDTGGDMEAAQLVPFGGDFDSEDGRKEFDTFIQFKPTISKATLEVFLSSIGLDKIDAIFKVSWLIPPRRTQFVLLLNDGSHVCTCRLHQNKDFVCMHVFHLKRDNVSVKYHIHLIPRRWFK